MNYKKARAWQDILLFGGAFVAGVGVWGFDSTFLGLLGLAMVLLSILVWWLYYRCPQCHESLGRGNPKHCPHCGAWHVSTHAPARGATHLAELVNAVEILGVHIILCPH